MSPVQEPNKHREAARCTPNFNLYEISSFFVFVPPPPRMIEQFHCWPLFPNFCFFDNSPKVSGYSFDSAQRWQGIIIANTIKRKPEAAKHDLRLVHCNYQSLLWTTEKQHQKKRFTSFTSFEVNFCEVFEDFQFQSNDFSLLNSSLPTTRSFDVIFWSFYSFILVWRGEWNFSLLFEFSRTTRDSDTSVDITFQYLHIFIFI